MSLTEIEPDDDEIDDVLNKCAEHIEAGTTKFSGMTYEQGVDAAIRWMQGDGENPMND